MGAKSGFALKFLQWFIRGVQFCCSAVVLAIFSYFLATLHNHELGIAKSYRAVEGISGAAVLYTIAGLLLLCCLAGHPFTSFIAMVLDVCFIGGFVYITTVNRAGASSCSGTLDTVFGTGNANDTPTAADGFTNLPTYREACKLETACLAVSIIAIFFFLISIVVEFVLVRHRRKEARFGPSPANNHTSGYGRRNRFMGIFKRRGTTKTADNPNALPAHTTPEQIRQSYNTETTAVGQEPATANKYGESGYQNSGRTAYPEQGVTQPPAGYRYNDGTYNA